MKATDHSRLDSRFAAFGWTTKRCNGHDCLELSRALEKTRDSPYIILANTVKAKGMPNLEDTLNSHYAILK